MGSVTIDKLENNKVKVSFEVTSEKFEEGIQKAYIYNRDKINIQGFRKGKAPRQIIEKMYGKDFFYEDGLNNVMQEAYELAINEAELDIVSRPEIDVKNISKEDGVKIEATVYVKPEITVKNYIGIEIEEVKTTIKEDDIQKVLDEEAQKNSRTEEVTRPIENTDIVNINFEGFIEDVAFDGGKGDNFDLTIGSNTFIDTFEEQLIGLSIGDKKDIKVTFPAEYGQADLQNKEALFKVTINNIKAITLPKIDDEFAKDVSEFDTLKEYKEKIKKDLEKTREVTAKHERENKVMEALIKSTKIEVPQPMIDTQVDNHIREYAQQLKSQGMELEMYLQYMGQTIDTLKEAYKNDSEKQVKGRIILETIAKVEKIEITDKDVKEELKRISDAYKMPMEKLEASIRPEDLKGINLDLKTQKALTLIMKNAKEVKK